MKEAIQRAIRKAYDNGYNDAKMAPDNCSTYRVQRAEREGADELLSQLQADERGQDKVNEEARSWPEDFAYENGDYMGKCHSCDKIFYGHKRRLTCKVCHTALASAPVAGEAAGDDMTLRDNFAAKAMQAQLTAFWAMETHHGWSHDEIAREAYAMADTMVKAGKQF